GSARRLARSRRLLEKEVRHHASEPAVRRILLESRVPVLTHDPRARLEGRLHELDGGKTRQARADRVWDGEDQIGALEHGRHGKVVFDAYRHAPPQSQLLQLRLERVVELSRRMHDRVSALDELLARQLAADRGMIRADDADEGVSEEPLLIERRADQLRKVAERKIHFARTKR